MKRAALRRFIEIEIVQKVIHDLSIVKADLRELPSVDGDDLVNVSGLAGVRIVHGRVLRIVLFGMGCGFDAAKRGLMAVHANGFVEAY